MVQNKMDLEVVTGGKRWGEGKKGFYGSGPNSSANI
jgi:hypothetical protein